MNGDIVKRVLATESFPKFSGGQAQPHQGFSGQDVKFFAVNFTVLVSILIVE